MIHLPPDPPVCPVLRPDWDGAAVSAVDEALRLALSPGPAALILLTAIAVRWRLAWVGLAAVVLWSVYTYFLVFAGGPANPQGLGRAEGCIGSPALFIALVTAICIAMIVYTAPSERRSS